MNRLKKSRKKPLYGNCRVYSPDGELMFLCVEKKVKWYLSRNLAIVIGEDPIEIRLKFQPKGIGNNGDKFFLAEKKNKCVVTGSEYIRELTKHHVVPHCYRKFMPDEVKSNNSHDVIPICVESHFEYEREYADKLKLKLAEKYNAPIEANQAINKDWLNVLRSSYALVQHEGKIPKKRVKFLKDTIKNNMGIKRLTQKEIERLSKIPIKGIVETKDTHGFIVVKQIIKEGKIQEFIEMWRKDFIDNMKPKYMPKYWDIKRNAFKK